MVREHSSAWRPVLPYHLSNCGGSGKFIYNGQDWIEHVQSALRFWSGHGRTASIRTSCPTASSTTYVAPRSWVGTAGNSVAPCRRAGSMPSKLLNGKPEGWV